MPIFIEGKVPLQGTVNLSGARNSAIKLIFASMYSNEDIILENVPRVESISVDIEIVQSMGGKAEWIGNNKLLLNGSGLSTFEVPLELGSKYRTAFLLAGPLLFRFGKARIPKVKEAIFKGAPVNRIIETWKSLGFDVSEDEDWINITSQTPKGAEISFKTSSHTGTENAILSAVLIEGETIINNASEEPEIEDLIEFCNYIGATVERVEPRKIKIHGTHVFRGCSFEVQSDKYEAAAFATAAILTKGNIVIKNIQKLSLVPFVNFLSKIGVNFEIQDDELRVWNAAKVSPSAVTISPSPGFVPDWQPFATLILTQAEGQSTVHDTVYTDRFEYTKDLNRMGAKIEIVKPSQVNIIPVISDDSYDYEKLGEPSTVVKIEGPSKLHAEKLHIIDPRFANVLVLAALAAEGRTELIDYKSLYEPTENFFDKLISLGAKISK
jgi:UDP-N-acetylglucosamine 1-carboxyvinyltransferase